jgi:D-glycero-alpha-D-manno-heptose-7-phosphate kinase
MIFSKTPFRISFFGGGSDYVNWIEKHGGCVISATIDKSIYLSIQKRPAFFHNKYRIVYSKIDNAKSLSEIKHGVVRKALEHFKVNDGLEIHYNADLPSRSGVGSSSSFSVGLINLLNYYVKKQKTSMGQLSKQSINFEQKILKETVGLQDQIAAAYGGFNKITFNKNLTFQVKKFNNKRNLNVLSSNLLLFHSGIYRTANFVAEKYVKKIDKSKNMMNILNMVEKAENHLVKGNLDDFGYLLNESWLEKRKISSIISNNRIDKIYNTAIENGAYGGKLLGAGNGGFLVFYVPKKKQEQIKKIFKKLSHVPFKFSYEGSKILKI